MPSPLKPRLDVLPPEQMRLWPRLAATRPLGFVLYGGTAIALRLGHRTSVDFDFFNDEALDRERLRKALPMLAKARTLQEEPDTWTVSVEEAGGGGRAVKVSFFGALACGRVGAPEVTEDGVAVASLDDLMATKLKVILQRAEAKDYRDIARMLEAGVSLPKGLAAARAMFGPAFQPSESLKALAFFQDGDLPSLSPSEQSLLRRAAGAVDELPETQLASKRLGLKAAPPGAGEPLKRRRRST